MADHTYEVNIQHSLPEEYLPLTDERTETMAALYNQLRDLGPDDFTDRFQQPLDDIHSYATDHNRAEMLFFLIGLEVANKDDIETGQLLGDAHTKFVFELGDDSFIDDYHYMADTVRDVDYLLIMTIRPNDCPPGSGQAASEVGISQFQELLTSALYKRFQYFQDDPEKYERVCLQPIVTSLEDHAERHSIE